MGESRVFSPAGVGEGEIVGENKARQRACRKMLSFFILELVVANLGDGGGLSQCTYHQGNLR